MADVVQTAEVVTPPAGLRFAYRFLGWRIEEPYRAWLLADLADPSWLRRYRVRHFAFVTASAAVIMGLFQLRYDRLPWGGVGGFIGSAFGPLILPERFRQAVARRQLLPGEETTWWHRLSNRTWTSINVSLVVVITVALVVGFEAIKRADNGAERAAVTCATPPPEVTLAVLEAFGSSEVYRPTLQVDAPGNAVLVRVGPPVSLYAVVTRRDDATLGVQPVELAAPGIYQQAIDDLDSCV